jgi:hypothetical protein
MAKLSEGSQYVAVERGCSANTIPMAKLSEGSQISITFPRRRDFFIRQLSLIPSLHFFLLHHRSSPVSIPFLCGLQLHLLPVLLHLIVSIILHCIVVSMAQPDLQAVLPHQVAPCRYSQSSPTLAFRTPMSCALLHGLTTISRQICAISSPRDPPPWIRAIDVDRPAGQRGGDDGGCIDVDLRI